MAQCNSKQAQFGAIPCLVCGHMMVARPRPVGGICTICREGNPRTRHHAGYLVPDDEACGAVTAQPRFRYLDGVL